MEFQSMTAPPVGGAGGAGGNGGPEEENSSSNEDETETSLPPDEFRTYIIIVNDDGSLSLDPSGIITEDADPQIVIPVNLPVNKLKSPDCPLPGATPLPGSSRNRKSKPQAVLYGGENELNQPLDTTPATNFATGTLGDFPTTDPQQILQMNGTTPEQVPGSMTGTGIDIAELGPQDIAILENVLQSESARELLENLSLPTGEIPLATPLINSHLWDHSYSTLSASIPPPPFANIRDASPSTPSSGAPQHPPTASVDPVKTSILESTLTSPVSVSVKMAKTPPAATPSVKSTGKGTFAGTQTIKPSAPVKPIPRMSPGSPSSTISTSPSMRRTSESEAAGNIRRSQRQQDRIERQEAERIMAENQQMMQREKEMMMETSGGSIKGDAASPAPSPAVSHFSEDSVGSRVASPLVQIQRTSSPEASPRSDKRPARQRKLPAHLADPNIVQLEEDAQVASAAPAAAEAEEEPVNVSEPSPQKPDDAESMDEEADEEAGEDDDPNKLWCICRRPHNNRFMICCDNCDDWFHGKCVGVTKTQAKKMENDFVKWFCPNCKKTVKQQQQPQHAAKGKAVSAEGGKMPAKAGNRRASGVSPRRGSTEVQQLVTPKSETATPARKKHQQQDIVPIKLVTVKEDSVTLKRRDSLTKTQQQGRRRKSSGSVSSQAEITEDGDFSDCIVCGKKSRAGSVFCSDACIAQRAAASVKKDSPVPPTPPANTTPSPSSQKLKRMNSLKGEQEKKDVAPIFDFHVIQAGAAKSTEVVPARLKEPVAQSKLSLGSTFPPASTDKATPKTPTTPVKSLPALPSSQASKGNTTSTTSLKQQATSTAITTSKGTLTSGGREKSSPTKDKSDKTSTPKSSSSKSSPGEKVTVKEKRKPAKESPKESDKDKETRAGKDEGMYRSNIVKTLKETLKTRLEGLSAEEKMDFPPQNTPEVLAGQVEEELWKMYGSSMNPKYRSKYRSIFFNMKDSKNHLFREIFANRLSPSSLVKMESAEMASAELVAWRNQENQKNLDMIKRAEIDKLVEAKKQQLLEKGADVDAAVEEQARKLDIADIIQPTAESTSDAATESDSASTNAGKHSSSSGKSHSSSSSHHKKDKNKHDKHKDNNSGKHKDKETKHVTSSTKERDERETRRSERHRHRSKDEKEEKKNIELKKKERSSKSKSNNTEKEERAHRGSKDVGKCRKDSETKEDSLQLNKKSDSIDKSNSEVSTENSPSSVSNDSPLDTGLVVEKPKTDIRNSVEVDQQELPSSTIKTPDFTTDEKKDKGEVPVFRTKLMMHELGHFRASAFHVSHNHLEGTVFPESPVPIVGRISPETVWDYLDKMKKSKEVIVLRLAPETSADNEGYMTFFTYLSSRGRLGVMGAITSPLKDVYLIPLDKHQPVNRALLPFRGPGLPKDRGHCLLAVITRHVQDISSALQMKRKTSLDIASVSPSLTKKKKLGDLSQQSPSSTTTSKGPGDKSFAVVGSTGLFVDPRKRRGPDGKPLPIKDVSQPDNDDDDEPYTPWEDEDDKDEAEVMDITGTPSPPPAPTAVLANKLLEDIERKIQQERQEIESITAAIEQRAMTGIPGLDGDFPLEETTAATSPIPDGSSSVSFFHKTPGSSSTTSTTVVPSELPVTAANISTASSVSMKEATLVKSSLPPTPIKDIISVGTAELTTDSTLQGSLAVSPATDEIIVLPETVTLDGEKSTKEEEAYSPSAFDDEDMNECNTNVDQQKASLNEEKIFVEIPPEVTVIQAEPTVIEHSPPPPGRASLEERARDIIPGLDLSDFQDEEMAVSSASAVPTVIDLDDEEDEEPPPPGESIASSKSSSKPTLDSVFSLPPPNYLSTKPKIQINLAPKISSLGSSSVLASVALGGSSVDSGSDSSRISTSPMTAATVSSKIIDSPRPTEPSVSSSSTAFPFKSSTTVSPLVLSPQHQQQPPPLRPGLTSGGVPIVTNIPPPGLVAMPPPPSVLPPTNTSIPPPQLPTTSIPPPNLINPLYHHTPLAQSATTALPPPGYPPLHHPAASMLGGPRPNLIPAPSVTGTSIINVNIPPPGTVGMVPVTAIPPLPTLRGPSAGTPSRFHQNSGQQGPPGSIGRFRHNTGRFGMPQRDSGKVSPPRNSPTAGGRGGRKDDAAFAGNRRIYGHSGDKDGGDGVGGDRHYRGPDRHGGGRKRFFIKSTRSRSPVRNRSRSRSRERDRRWRRRSRTPPRRRSRSRSPSSRYSRSKSPQRRRRRSTKSRSRSNSKSRSPSSSASRKDGGRRVSRTKPSHSPSPVKSSSSATASIPTSTALSTPAATAAPATAPGRSTPEEDWDAVS